MWRDGGQVGFDRGGRGAGVWRGVRGQGELWTEWFEGMEVISTPQYETVLVGPVIDQPALHGLLARIRDFNLELVSVEQVDCESGLLYSSSRRRSPSRARSGARSWVTSIVPR
ncbi:MAG TPA: hypothetical protein VLH85_02905 [Levilinea sp.]|nr:hypothetical protein [Levilinea sp.]